jgi:hypothetical protein
MGEGCAVAARPLAGAALPGYVRHSGVIWPVISLFVWGISSNSNILSLLEVNQEILVRDKKVNNVNFS